MNSPLERARLLDAEMQLQRAWLELNLRANFEWCALAVGKVALPEARGDWSVDPQTQILVGRGGRAC